MKRFVLLSAIAFYPFVSHATKCAEIKPQDYLVFSRGEISYGKSDFQGLTGAQGAFTFERFEVGPVKSGSCPRLVTGGKTTLISGHVAGGIETTGTLSLKKVSVAGRIAAEGTVKIQESSSHGRVKQAPAAKNLAKAGEYFLDQSSRLARLAPTVKASLTDGVLEVAATPGAYSIASITSTELSSAKVIRLKGDDVSVLVINVSGTQASLENLDLQLTGIQVGRVLLNFFEAQTLRVTASGSKELGIGATLLAPLASVTFWNGLVTGGLYVGSLCGDGQVNPGHFVGWLPEIVAPPAPPIICPPQGAAFFSQKQCVPTPASAGA
jgi:choice-of-anchor A domain-containing protein